MAYITLDGMRMYYAEHGTPDGSPLVLLHGFTGTGEFWSNQLPALGAQYRLLVPDLRLHGRTDNPGGSAAMNARQFAHDIIGFCRALGIEGAAFCGESFGATLLLPLALEAPELVAACILTGGTHYFDEGIRTYLKQETPDNIDEGWRAILQQAPHSAQGPDHWRRVVEAHAALGSHGHAEDFLETEELHEIGAPVLVVHGDSDSAHPVEDTLRLYRLLPDCELCVLPDTPSHIPDTPLRSGQS
jgi:pimeloyl-ACP methyl ester carboxylesterase